MKFRKPQASQFESVNKNSKKKIDFERGLFFISAEFCEFGVVVVPDLLAANAFIVTVFHLKAVDLAVWAEAAAVEPVAVGIEVVFDEILRNPDVKVRRQIFGVLPSFEFHF